MPHFYTVQEANARLPELTSILMRMRAASRQASEVQGRTSGFAESIKRNGNHNPAEDVALSHAAQAMEASLTDGLRRLAEWDIELKDIERGLVDFPALREGRSVLLCWQLGEPEVSFWHEYESGFAGRQPIDDRLDR